MVDWQGTYATLAEISIGILGFTAIVSALSSPGSREQHSEAHFRMLWFLDKTLLLLAGSVLPFAVFQWVDSEAAGWRTAVALLIFLAVSLQLYRFRISEYVQWARRLPKPIFFVFGPADAICLLAMLALAFGGFHESQTRIFTAILYYLLAYSIFGFVYFVELVWKEKKLEA